MSKLIPSFAALAGALFHHLVGSGGTGTDSGGFVGVTKIVYGLDQTTPTDVLDASGLPIRPRSVAPDVVPTLAALDLTGAGNSLTITVAGYGTAFVYVPAFSGAAVITAEQSPDGVLAHAALATLHPLAPVGGTAGTKTSTIAASASGQWFKVSVRGAGAFHLVVTTAGTGTMTPIVTVTQGAALLGVVQGDYTALRAGVTLLDTTGTPAGVAGNALVTTADTRIVNPSGSFTRPTGALTYAAGQLIANNATAASVVPVTIGNVARIVGQGVAIPRLLLTKSTNVLAGASFTVHVFSTAPTGLSVGDGGAFNVANVLQVNKAGYIGSFDVTMDGITGFGFLDGAGGFGVPRVGQYVDAVLAATTLYGLIEARATYVGASGEGYTVTLDSERP